MGDQTLQPLVDPATWPYSSVSPGENCSGTGYCVYQYVKSIGSFVRVDLQGTGDCSNGYVSAPSAISSLTELEKELLDIIYAYDPEKYYYSCCEPAASSN